MDIVTFSSPNQTDNAILDVHQDIQDDSSNNVTAFLGSELLFYKNNFRDFQVDDSIVNSLLTGNNAYKMNYTYTDNDGSKIKALEFGPKIGDKVYYINFNSKKTIFDKYLPIVQAMINSFKVTSTNNNHDKLNL